MTEEDTLQEQLAKANDDWNKVYADWDKADDARIKARVEWLKANDDWDKAYAEVKRVAQLIKEQE
jgi:hypothetical protein